MKIRVQEPTALPAWQALEVHFPKIFDPIKAKTTPSNMAPQIAKRAYELYEQRSRKDGQAVHDWGQAEREIGKLNPITRRKKEKRS